MDEIDSILGARTSKESSHTRHLKNQFMLNWDGFNSSGNVIMMGATNRPFDLDDAVIDRFSQRLFVDYPNKSKRAEIIKNLLKNETVDSDLDYDVISEKTENFSGRDLRNLCIEAVYQTIEENLDCPESHPKKKRKLHISSKHLLNAIVKMSPGTRHYSDSESIEALRRWSSKNDNYEFGSSTKLSYFM